MNYYRYHVFFCTNERDDGRPSCGERCSADLRDYAKSRVKALGLAGQGRVRVNMAGCLDRCDEGPTVVIYPEGTWYRVNSREDVDELIREHLQNGRIADRLTI